MQALKKQGKEKGPQTDDELHAWILKYLGMNIPRVAVCEDHQAPFSFIADLYFERVTSAIAMANRGGSKTMSSAILHLLNSLFKTGCLSGDSLVDCPRDYERYPDGIPISQIKIGQLIWTFNRNIWRFELKRIKNVFKQPKQQLFKLTLDNGKIIRATCDHKFMKRDGTWHELLNLKENDSLMPLYRDYEPYVRINPAAKDGGGRIKEYDAMSDAIFKTNRIKNRNKRGDDKEKLNLIVDHIDDRRVNTSEENLQQLTTSDHAKKHHSGRSWDKKRNQTEAIKICYECNNEFHGWKGSKWCDNCTNTQEKICPICGNKFLTSRSIRKERDTCNRSCAVKKSHLTRKLVYNHRVVSIEIDVIEETWDLEVEDNHNFVVNGVVVHNCESLSVGAIEAQAKRCYENLKKLLIYHGGPEVYEPKDHPEIVRTIESETTFRNGSKVEIVPGTMAAVSGPHPQKVTADEQDQMDPSVWQQSRHMSMSKTNINPDGTETIIKAQDWVTSTRQRPAGPMQRLIDEINDAIKNGNRPPWTLYSWCVYETAKPVKNCMYSNPDLPKEELCGCDKVVKGRWEDGSQRRFSDCCQGKLSRSQGFVDLDNIWKRFQESDIDEWEAQQECSRPEVGGMVFKTFNKQRYGIKWWSPNPELGHIYQGVDFGGGTSPAAINYYQILDRDIKWWGIDQARTDEPAKLLKTGTRVCFDEIYISEIGNNELGLIAKRKEKEWQNIYPKFNVERRFADPANKASRHDWKAMGLTTQFFCTRDIKEQIRTCNNILREDLVVFDADKCKMFPLEAEAYHYPEKKPGMEYDPEIPIDDFNHCMSNFRYTMENLKYLERRGSIIGNIPKTGDRIHLTAEKSPIKSSAPRYMPRR